MMQVLAYVSLAAHVVARADVSDKLARGSPDRIPAILLARLALSHGLQGSGLEGELLWDVLSRNVAASQLTGARGVVVDAVDPQAASFYRHHGFQPVPKSPFRLVQKTNDIAAALGL